MKTDAITIRTLGEGDAPALWRLAALDSTRVPRGEALGAFVDGELRAAVSTQHRTVAADPFRPTADLVALLSARCSRGRSTGSAA